MIRNVFPPVYQDTIYNNFQQPDTARTIAAPRQPAVLTTHDSSQAAVPRTTVKQVITVKPLQVKEEPETEMVVAPKKEQDTWNTGSNFFLDNGLAGVIDEAGNTAVTVRLSSTSQPENIKPARRIEHKYDWLLGIFLFLVILFIWIRSFYSKFFSTLGNALMSYHLSLKLFEERNVLLQRVSIVLDFVYVIVFSVFLFQFIEYLDYPNARMKGINLYLVLFNVVMLYVLFRTFILRMIGSLFLARPLFAEYIHNTLVVNKGLGIALFPVVILIQYLPYKILPVILVLGFVVVAAAFILKTMRSYQIIIRRNVLFLYLILYLCTLEILPLLLGFKFVKTLIQSN